MKTKTIILIDSAHGINYHRFMVPIIRLSKQGYDVTIEKTVGDILKYPPEIIKQIWTSRVLTLGESYKTFKNWCKLHNIKVVIDVDDYWYVTNGNVNKIAFDTQLTNMIKSTLEIADVITTPSEYLANVIRKEVNPDVRIAIIENALELNEPHWVGTRDKYVLDKEGKQAVKFGYIGASGHDRDVALVGRSSDNMFVVTTEFGNYFNMLNADFALPTIDHALYHNHYRWVDVSLAPLENNKFNRCKSSLKIAEAVASKTAIIVSDISTYAPLITQGVDGYICKTRKDWRSAMIALNDIDKAREFAHNLHEKYKERFDVDTVNQIRVKQLGIEKRNDA